MSLSDAIKNKLQDSLKPMHLEVINESAMHNVPSGSETHFKIILVSEAFNDMSRIRRHRQVNDLLKSFLAEGVHALSLKLFTIEEWQLTHSALESPLCRGGRSKETTSVKK